MEIELAVRVWVARRKPTVSPEAFVSALRSRFVPITVQWMSPLGLHAYYPSLLNPDAEQGPHEIALVFYESVERYQAARATPQGKAYAAAHGEIFDKALFANWSLAWQSGAACQFNCAYHAALPQAVDWNQGQVAVFSLAWSAEFSPANWIEEVGLPYLAALPGLRHWIMYGNPRYLIAWVLLDTGAFDRDLLRCALARVSPPHHSARLGFLSVSRDARVSATAAPAPPVDFDSGETLHVLLRDRT